MARRKAKRSTRTRKKRSQPKLRNKESRYVRSLKRHADPANFTLHVVAIPFLILGLIMHRIDLLVIALFWIFSGTMYALIGPERVQLIWIKMYKDNVSKWFSFLGLILLVFGLWNYDLITILIGLGSYLVGLLYIAITEYA